jgi:type IV secretory pathway TrbD component
MEIQIPAQFCARIRQSANRPHLLVGCEPTALMLALVLCIIVGYSVPTWYGVGGAILLFFVLRQLLQEMGAKRSSPDCGPSREPAVPAGFLDGETKPRVPVARAVTTTKQRRRYLIHVSSGGSAAGCKRPV